MKIFSTQDNIIKYTVGETGEGVFSERAEILLSSGLARKFSSSDQAIIEHCAKINSTDNYRYTNSKIFLSCFILCVLMISIILGPKYAYIFDTARSGTIILFPLSFAAIDAINEIYGRRSAQFVVYVIASCLFLSGAFVYLLMSMEHAGDNVTHYEAVFARTAYFFMISGITVLVSDSVNNYIYQIARRLTNGKWILLRCSISTLVGQCVYSFLVGTLLYYNEKSVPELIAHAYGNYSFKIIYSVATIPMTIILVKLVKIYCQQPYQLAPQPQ